MYVSKKIDARIRIKPLVLINAELSGLRSHKMQFCFYVIETNHPKKKSRKAVSFAILSERVNYQGVHLIRELKYIS